MSKTADAQIEVQGEREVVDTVVRVVQHQIAFMLQSIACCTHSEFARHVMEEDSRRIIMWNPDEHEAGDIRKALRGAVPESDTRGRGDKSL